MADTAPRPGVRRYVAHAPRGLEQITAKEIRALGGGVGKTRVSSGRVGFEGPWDAVYRANLHLRAAERIIQLIDIVDARFEEELRSAARSVPWERWIRPGAPVSVVASARGCRLYHTGLLEEVVREGLAARNLGTGELPEGSAPTDPGEVVARPQTIDLRGTDDRWEFGIDTSGRGLHRRGYRKASAKAPLRETIAAGMLLAVGWKGDRPFLDPMCGSGTLPCEAAWIAARRAPGLDRPFAFEDFPSVDLARWAEVKEAARQALRWDAVPFIEGADKAAGAIRAARANAERAELVRRVRWVQRPLRKLPQVAADSPPGLIVFNPPFGHRAEAAKGAPRGSDAELAAWASWGELLRERRPGWEAWLLAPHPQLAAAAGAKGRPAATIAHGGISVGLHRVL